MILKTYSKMNLTLTQHDSSELKQWLSKDLYNRRNDCTSFDQKIELRSKPGQITCSLPLIQIILPNTTAQVAKPIYGSVSRHKYSIISCILTTHICLTILAEKPESGLSKKALTFSFSPWEAEIKALISAYCDMLVSSFLCG